MRTGSGQPPPGATSVLLRPPSLRTTRERVAPADTAQVHSWRHTPSGAPELCNRQTTASSAPPAQQCTAPAVRPARSAAQPGSTAPFVAPASSDSHCRPTQPSCSGTGACWRLPPPGGLPPPSGVRARPVDRDRGERTGVRLTTAPAKRDGLQVQSPPAAARPDNGLARPPPHRWRAAPPHRASLVPDRPGRASPITASRGDCPDGAARLLRPAEISRSRPAPPVTRNPPRSRGSADTCDRRGPPASDSGCCPSSSPDAG